MATTRPRVRRHDPALIEGLLSRRDAEGITLARLASQSGLPIGTLAYWSWRRRQRTSTPAFAEVVVRDSPRASDAPPEGQPMFDLALANGRRITIAAGFDGDDLRRLLAIVEAPAC